MTGIAPQPKVLVDTVWSADGLAREFSLSVSDVTNYLASVRREFRRIALEQLREMSASEEDFQREARALFGVEPQ